MFPQYGELRPTNGWDRFGNREYGAPQQIPTGFASWLRYCSNVAYRRPTKLCTMFGRLLGWYIIYTFFGAVAPLMEFCRVQSSLCVQILHSPILAALLHGTPAAGQPNFAALNRGRHLYSAGMPSRWVSAHILVYFFSVHRFFDVPGPIFAKLCHTTRYLLK